MATYKLNDLITTTSVEFTPQPHGKIQIAMIVPDNDYAGGCINVLESDFKEIALAILNKDKIKKLSIKS